MVILLHTHSHSSVGHRNNALRHFNDRLILRNLLVHQRLTKAELSRNTGLTPRAIQLIIERLSAEGFILEHAPQKGKVGQPSVPLSLNPGGAFAIGVKVGRRRLTVQSASLDLKIQDRRDVTYDIPEPTKIVVQAAEMVKSLAGELPEGRVSGLTLVTPQSFSSDVDRLYFPEGTLTEWEQTELSRSLSEMTGLPTTNIVDSQAACLAEHWLGNHDWTSYGYLFVGTFLSSSFVLDNEIFHGQRGPAVRLDRIPVSTGSEPSQLVDKASLFHLDKTLVTKGLPGILANGLSATEQILFSELGSQSQAVILDWLDEASSALAQAISLLQDVMGFEGFVLESALPVDLKQKLAQAIQARVANIPVVAGSQGPSARSVGAAIHPLLPFFHTKLFWKEYP